MCGHKLSPHFSKYQGKLFLDCTVNLCWVFYETGKLSYKVPRPFCLPICNEWEYEDLSLLVFETLAILIGLNVVLISLSLMTYNVEQISFAFQELENVKSRTSVQKSFSYISFWLLPWFIQLVYTKPLLVASHILGIGKKNKFNSKFSKKKSDFFRQWNGDTDQKNSWGRGKVWEMIFPFLLC